MLDILETEKSFILKHIGAGDTVADFTMGNGHDTLFFSQTVGEGGQVFAFDIQQGALESTKKRLEENNAPENYTLICDSHHNAAKYIDRPIKAGMFNLGWLPGGDKSITTLRESTMPAIEAAIELMDQDAILNVAVYPGHAEGDAEGKMLEEYFATLSRHRVCCTKVAILNSPTSPYFFVLETKS